MIYACMCAKSLQLCWLFANVWTVAHQASLSMGFSKQEYWSGLPFPLPGDLPNPGIKPTSLCLLHWQAGSVPVAPPEKTITVISGKCSGIFKLIFKPTMRNPHGFFNYVPLFPISIITFTTLDRFHHILNSSFTIQFLVNPFFLL